MLVTARLLKSYWDVEIPLKAQAIRIVLCELSRIIDHIVCLGANAVDLGALTGFFHLFQYESKFTTCSKSFAVHA